ncbi:MAG: rRNA maturation RNase YbeY [Fidelibacterota bacterium]
MNRLHLEFDPRLNRVRSNAVRAIVNQVWTTHAVHNADLTIIFGDDALLSRLKEEFFHVRQLTDVIAFRLNDDREPSPEGEVYISLPRARENAAQYQEPEAREIARLVIHGCLHLLGFDDRSEEEQLAMRSREDELLAQVPWQELIALKQDER